MKNHNLIESFKNSFNGIFFTLASERNMKIHSIAAVITILLGFLLGIDTVRWAFLFIAIGFVVVCELINTSIEKLTDMVTSEYSEDARKVKDIAAAAVLVSSVIAVAVGILVFWQPLKERLK
jgi:diacylglycerol kinase